MQLLKRVLLYLVTFFAGALVLLLMVFIGWVSLPFKASSPTHEGALAGATQSSAKNVHSTSLSTVQKPDAISSQPINDINQLSALVQQQAQDIKKMQAALQASQEARADLETRVEALDDIVQAVQQQQQENVEQLATLNKASPATEQPNTRWAGRRGLITSEQQYENLINAGVEQTLALSIKQRQDAFELERLELVDQAAREGWRGTDRFRTAFEELIDSRLDIRDELGDEAYDNYLYSSGVQNRVVIVNVIEGSAAQLAGMQVGDVVLEYGGERIYSTRALQQATREGVRGESIVVLLEREGSTFNTEIARGPLGVSLDSASVQPGSF